jgi:hypothetical protein
MGAPSHIKLSKYLTHTAVWQVTEVGTYGDTYVSTATTVKCLYYTGETLRDLPGRSVEGIELEHLALLYSTPTIKVGDLLVTIVNQDGETIRDQARITRVEAFHGWSNGRGTILKQVTLEFN